ncbi:MAG: D-alanyl-D-alanine carboxypeptidase [Ruminococcus sp.]|nr:D-alanyl-D-alanine carboxypeptidase [Ruminococcus sp.]
MGAAACFTAPSVPVVAAVVPPEISARSCVVIDALSGDVLFEKNSAERLPMASTTKIMSSLIALEGGDLDTPFTVDSNAIKVEGSSMGLQEGDTVTMRALVTGMLLPSGNDAAGAAAVRIAGSVEGFVYLMNERAQAMGLTDTHFVTPSGLDDYTDEHYSTAMDMAMLTRQALKNPDFAEICSKKTAQLEFGDPPYTRWLTNTNKLLSTLEGCVGVKTGFTDKAGRCLVSACERQGSTLICVTLNDQDDWSDHTRLYDYAFSLMREVPLTPELSGYKIDTVTGERVYCRGESASITLPPSAVGRLQRYTLIRPFLYTYSTGEQVGSTVFVLDGEKVACLPIVVIS